MAQRDIRQSILTARAAILHQEGALITRDAEGRMNPIPGTVPRRAPLAYSEAEIAAMAHLAGLFIGMCGKTYGLDATESAAEPQPAESQKPAEESGDPLLGPGDEAPEGKRISFGPGPREGGNGQA